MEAPVPSLFPLKSPCLKAKPKFTSFFPCKLFHHIFTSKTILSTLIFSSAMSSRRSRSRQASTSVINDAQMADLVSKLQQLIPHNINQSKSSRVSASTVLQETCNYIRSLHREVDDLSGKLSELLESTDTNSAQAAIIRSLLM